MNNVLQAATAFLDKIQDTVGVHPNLDTLRNANGPQLIPFFVLHLLSWFIPGLWILQIPLSFLGIGLAGPGRGSVAAWLQGYMRGGTGAAGGWFSLLLAAVMGVTQICVGFIFKAPLIGGLLAVVLPYIIGA